VRSSDRNAPGIRSEGNSAFQKERDGWEKATERNGRELREKCEEVARLKAEKSALREGARRLEKCQRRLEK